MAASSVYELHKKNSFQRLTELARLSQILQKRSVIPIRHIKDFCWPLKVRSRVRINKVKSSKGSRLCSFLQALKIYGLLDKIRGPAYYTKIGSQINDEIHNSLTTLFPSSLISLVITVSYPSSIFNHYVNLGSQQSFPTLNILYQLISGLRECLLPPLTELFRRSVLKTTSI